MTIKAIETSYKGYRFRSRLEARWAVFFDALGASWEYEPEGFETAAGWYLPDFRLYFQNPKGAAVPVYVEVRPIDAFEPKVAALNKLLGPYRTGVCEFVYGDPLSWFEARLFRGAGCSALECCLPGGNHSSHPDFWRAAGLAARAARFEHGEVTR